MYNSSKEFYVVQFENGSYYGTGESILGREVAEIKDASHYTEKWQLSDDLYFAAYMSMKEIDYRLIKVKSTKITTYEILD